MDEELAEQLCNLERLLLTPAVRQSSSAAALLSDDFVEFGSSGNRFNKAEIIRLLLQATPVVITDTDMTATLLADRVVLITYIACRHGEPNAYSRRSSIWQCRSGDWKMVFHQGTPMPSG